MNVDEALLASVLRKLAQQSGWFDYRHDSDREPWVNVDGSATITPEEFAAVERMVAQLASPTS